MTAPCKDCKERTARCHCTCDRYREYAEDNQRQRERKYMANKIKDDVGAVVSTSIKRSQSARQLWRAYKEGTQ